MNHCPKLKEIVTLDDYGGNFENYNEYLYRIFKDDLFIKKMHYKSKINLFPSINKLMNTIE